MSTFTDIVGAADGGRAFENLNDSLREVVTAVRATRKAGKISVAIKVVPNGEFAINIFPEIKVVVPEATPATTTYFVDEHGNLVRRDPRQSELVFREVADETTGELRNVP
jgi:hypothetical protein